MKKIKIGSRWIGEGEPTYIIIETGTTCNGNLETALKMVDASIESGADAIKFQMIGPEYFMSDQSISYEYEWAQGKKVENMYTMLKSLKFDDKQWRDIKTYCDKRKFAFFASVDYIPGVDLAESLGMVAYKLGSWDLLNYPLIRRMAKTGKPIVVDLGPAYVKEIEKLLDVARQEGNEQIILLHCTHSKTDEGINLRSIPYLQKVFDLTTGYSADSRDFVPDIASVALGAHVIEKRLTLNKNFEGHHHIKALEPQELKEYIQMIRRSEQMLGRYAVVPSSEDIRQRDLYFVSLVADSDIASGVTITQNMVACKRPGNGISPDFIDIVVGRTAKRPIKKNQLLSWSDI